MTEQQPRHSNRLTIVREYDPRAGHVFLSYVHENSREVDWLQRTLETAGVPVWRDTEDLWPGEDWREKIRHAIIDDALVFIACFSHKSLAREKSYQNEELHLAIEQLRLRRPDIPWLIPVRFDDCSIPDIDIGGGRTMASIQRADLFGKRSDEGAARLAVAVQRILARRTGFAATGTKATASLRKGDDVASITNARAAELLAERRPAAPSTGKWASTDPARPGSSRGRLWPRRPSRPARRGLRVALIGPPGAGKGTLAPFITSHLAIPTISTGEIFRSNFSQGTELARVAKAYLDRGDLAPDEVTIAMLASRIQEDDAQAGFLLDGFPLNVPQAETLKQMLAEWDTRLDLALELVMDDDEVVRRLSGRRTCRRCGRVWHVRFDPPARSERCDDCGGELFQRDDDREETIRHRLDVYQQQTQPLIAFYADEAILLGIDATGPIEEVTDRALSALRRFVRQTPG
jgi:adenylate kinase